MDTIEPYLALMNVILLHIFVSALPVAMTDVFSSSEVPRFHPTPSADPAAEGFS